MVRWNQLSFTPPAGFIDESVLSFVDDNEDPRVTLTFTREPRDGEPIEYAEAARDELVELMPGTRARGQREVEHGGLRGVHLELDLHTSDGPRRQHQVYLAVGDELVVVIATSRIEDLNQAQGALAAIVGSLRVLPS